MHPLKRLLYLRCQTMQSGCTHSWIGWWRMVLMSKKCKWFIFWPIWCSRTLTLKEWPYFARSIKCINFLTSKLLLCYWKIANSRRDSSAGTTWNSYDFNQLKTESKSNFCGCHLCYGCRAFNYFFRICQSFFKNLAALEYKGDARFL